PVVSLHYPATSALYPLSLHDALPISSATGGRRRPSSSPRPPPWPPGRPAPPCPCADSSSPRSPPSSQAGSACSAGACCRTWAPRSEEHTSELQSREKLVCRLLLEKKK